MVTLILYIALSKLVLKLYENLEVVSKLSLYKIPESSNIVLALLHNVILAEYIFSVSSVLT